MWAIHSLKVAAATEAATTKHLLSAYYVAGTVLGNGNLRKVMRCCLNQKKKKVVQSSCLQRAYSFVIHVKKHCKFITAVQSKGQWVQKSLSSSHWSMWKSPKGGKVAETTKLARRLPSTEPSTERGRLGNASLVVAEGDMAVSLWGVLQGWRRWGESQTPLQESPRCIPSR